MDIRVGDRVRIKPEYKEYIWYSNNIYTVLHLIDGVAVLDNNLRNRIDGRIKANLLYSIKEERKNKLESL